ncbi:MAG TPA: YWFCY domain-containing protein [Puia sp.]|nr:YWFCY domain-containing protein [Puia sp.]
MNTGEDLYGMRKSLDLARWISIALLLMHFYFICYGAFREWGWTAPLSDRLLQNIRRTGLFDSSRRVKLFSLAFLLISLLGARGRKDGKLGYKSGLMFILIGAAVYFGSIYLLAREDKPTIVAPLYMGVCFIGWLLVLTGGMQLSKVIGYSLQKEFFRKKEGGFEQEERLIESDFSINLMANYELNGEIRRSHINFINGRRGVLVIGSPGSGKSWFIVKPAMEQMMRDGFSMLIFDFKYDVLTRHAYSLFCKYRKHYPSTARFYSINFTDLTRSHRCNVIAPGTLRYLSDATDASATILLAINKTWAKRQGDFFIDSPVNFLAALIWFLKKYKGGIFALCRMPLSWRKRPTTNCLPS